MDRVYGVVHGSRSTYILYLSTVPVVSYFNLSGSQFFISSLRLNVFLCIFVHFLTNFSPLVFLNYPLINLLCRFLLYLTLPWGGIDGEGIDNRINCYQINHFIQSEKHSILSVCYSCMFYSIYRVDMAQINQDLFKFNDCSGWIFIEDINLLQLMSLLPCWMTKLKQHCN